MLLKTNILCTIYLLNCLVDATQTTLAAVTASLTNEDELKLMCNLNRESENENTLDTNECKNQYARYNYLLNRANIERDTKKLILSRLNLTKEPRVALTDEQFKFLQLQKEIAKRVNQQEKRAIHKTKYDKTHTHAKIVKTMYEATEVVTELQHITIYFRDKAKNIIDLLLNHMKESSNCIKLNKNSTCLTFQVSIDSLYSSIFDDQEFKSRLIKTYRSVSLWIYLQMPIVNRAHIKTLRIRNRFTHKKLTYKNLKNGWNTIEIGKLLADEMEVDNMSLNSSLIHKFTIECLKNCSILVSQNEHTTNESSQMIYISSSDKKRPLISFSQQDSNRIDAHSRHKRDSNATHSKHLRSNEFNLYERETVRRCEDNVPNPNKECCLVTHVITFNQLKWSPWIISPASFTANYCIGRCTSNSFVKSSYNADIKHQYNTLVVNDKIKKEMISSCCHPISMSSIKIKYIRMNEHTGQMETILQNLPNMIVDNCGCS